jgi:hypothetical protein
MSQIDQLNLKIASFVKEALDLQEEPVVLASEIVAFKRDANAGISTIELDSSVGVAAFLVYHYHLALSGDDGRTGADLFQTDLQTLERAAELDSPGPRVMAHAVTSDDAFILATTPATLRALTGTPGTEPVEANESNLLPGSDTQEIRKEAASQLLDLLKRADHHANAWLNAIRAEGQFPSEGGNGEDLIAFNEEETELALFLLDEQSIQHLLRLLNLVLNSARAQAEHAAGGSNGPVA